MEGNGKDRKTSVRIPADLYSQLANEAKHQDRTMHSLMIHALREYMRGRAAQRPDTNA